MKTPKSLLVVLIDVLIYVFDTTFDRGVKVRLFCSPQWRLPAEADASSDEHLKPLRAHERRFYRLRPLLRPCAYAGWVTT